MSDHQFIVNFRSGAERVLQHLHAEFSRLQTGRASAALVESVPIEAYGQKQLLKAVAGITIQDARTIVVQPWDPSVASSVERALAMADLGASPVSDGHILRLTLPPMTEERRQKLTKVVHQLTEEARISLRQQRDAVRDAIKKEPDEDLRYSLLESLEKCVKDANDKVEGSKANKEQELMKV